MPLVDSFSGILHCRVCSLAAVGVHCAEPLRHRAELLLYVHACLMGSQRRREDGQKGHNQRVQKGEIQLPLFWCSFAGVAPKWVAIKTRGASQVNELIPRRHNLFTRCILGGIQGQVSQSWGGKLKTYMGVYLECPMLRVVCRANAVTTWPTPVQYGFTLQTKDKEK